MFSDFIMPIIDNYRHLVKSFQHNIVKSKNVSLIFFLIIFFMYLLTALHFAAASSGLALLVVVGCTLC